MAYTPTGDEANFGLTPAGQVDPNNPLNSFIRGISQFLTGAGSLATASGDMSAARNAANVADPFGSQRGQYQPMLYDFLTNPGNNPMSATAGSQAALSRMEQLMQHPEQITSMPGYQFGLDRSLEAVNRGAGASGLLNSGNRLMALQDRGEGYARSWYNDTLNQMMGDINANLGVGNQFLNAQGQGFNQLATVSGVNAGSPGAAAAALMQGRRDQAGSLGAGIGGVASGLTNLLPGIQRWLGGGGGGGGGGWGGATPGAANDSWDVSGIGSPGGFDANGGWDVSGLGGANGGWDASGLFGDGGGIDFGSFL